jgi:hypothetical protein
MRLSVKAMALAGAIFWAGAIFLTTWWLILLGQGGVNIIFTKVYPGYCVSPLGSLVGLVWAFVDGLIMGLIFAWLYNLFVPKAAS